MKREDKWRGVRWEGGGVPLGVVREEDDVGGRGMKRGEGLKKKKENDENMEIRCLLSFFRFRHSVTQTTPNHFIILFRFFRYPLSFSNYFSFSFSVVGILTNMLVSFNNVFNKQT